MDEKTSLISRMLADHRTTRREFITQASVLGLTATAASTMWSKSAAATPKTGGHLRAGINGANVADTLDPGTFLDTFMLTIGHSVRDNLTTIGADNLVEGGLATSWEPSADAATWTFELRKGVEFSNGKSFTAEDVIASINMHRGEDSTSGATGVVAGIKDIVADGKNRVVFQLKSGNADFPYTMTDYHLNIVPSKGGVADWESGAGTGAYTLAEFEPGVRAVLKKNPNRWQQETGFVDSAELIAMNDVNSRQTALVSDAVDVINKPSMKTIELLKKSHGVQVVDVPGRIWHTGIMQVNTPPFDNSDLRMGLKYAIDREEYLKKILGGYGTMGNDHPIGPAFRYHAADIPQRTYDPDKANHYFKKSGFDGAKIDLHAGDIMPGGSDAAVLYKESAAKAGININIIPHPTDGYWSEVWNVLPFVLAWWGPRATEDLILSIAFLGDSSWNSSRITNDRLDKLIIDARAELNDDLRTEMYRDIQLIIRDEGGDMVPAFANLVQVVSGKVGVPKDDAGNWKIAGSWEMDGGHFVKRWWMN